MIDLRNYQVSITSQYGEDGILKKIFEVIGSGDKRCVEFGAYSLRECSNTYSLWCKDGWEALLIEGDKEKSTKIKADYDSLVKSSKPPAGAIKILNKFIESNGNNSLDNILRDHGWGDGIDLCVIDVDGLDYQIFESMQTNSRVVVCEFNPTIPLEIELVGNSDGNYLGCSATSLHQLAVKKGYCLVACTKVNCIFVKNLYKDNFENSDNLRLLFDNFAINYIMTDYDGSVFLTRKPYYHSNLLSKNIEVEIGSLIGEFWVPSREIKYSYIFSRYLFNILNYYSPRTANFLRNFLRKI